MSASRTKLRINRTQRGQATAVRRSVRGITVREPDDGARGMVGLVATLVSRKDGSSRLVFDDARATRAGRWAPVGLFTSRDYPPKALRGGLLARSELEKIGALIVARLLAFEETEWKGR